MSGAFYFPKWVGNAIAYLGLVFGYPGITLWIMTGAFHIYQYNYWQYFFFWMTLGMLKNAWRFEDCYK